MKENHYYRLKSGWESDTYYIKYKDLIDYHINTYWYIVNGVYYDKNLNLWNGLFNCEEVDFSNIVDLLPNSHPDRLIYIRKQKINKLLNEI